MHCAKLIQFFWLVLLLGCTSTHLVSPLPENDWSATFSAGGPFIDYADAVIPMPLSAVAVAYGYTNDLSVYSGLHTTALLYGTAQADVGVLYNIRKASANYPGISVAPALNLMTDVWRGEFRWYPSMDANVYWYSPQNGNMSYLGMANWFVPRRHKAHGEKQDLHWIPSLQLGHQWIWPQWRIGAEMKYLAFLEKNQYSIVDYRSINEFGAIGVYLSVSRRF